MSKDIVRVLLVEDSPSDARLLCEALQDYPLQRFEIEQAERLSEAVAFLRQKSFDAILLDLSLPDSRGLETCARLSHAAGQAPIIVLTGADDETTAAEAMRFGVQDYLVKGQTPGSMIGRTVRYAVERSQSQQALREVNERLQQQAEELQAQTRELTTANEELRESEQTLHKTEERLHLAMESGKVGIWEWEPGTERVEWSQGFYRLLGYEPEELAPTQEAFRQRVHPQDRDRQQQALRESLERCEDYFCEFRVVWPDGSVHWVEARGEYVFVDGENGPALRMRGVLADIDRRKQAEEALEQQNRFLHSVLESLTHPFYVVDAADHSIVIANAAAGFRAGSARPKCHLTTHHSATPCGDAGHACPLDEVKRTGKPATVEHVHYDADGTPRNVEVHSYPLFDDQGRVVQMIEYCLDITERKRAEEALRAANEQLQQQTRTLQAQTDRLGVVNAALQQSQAALRRSHDELEQRVQERTAELLRANEQLSREIAERKQAERAARQAHEALEHRARQLQKLTLELSDAEERERRRLAEILHDDLQQVLAAAKFHLGLMKGRTKYDPLVQAAAAQIDQMLKDAIEKSRSLSHELSPAVLHHSDLAETLGWLARQVQAKHGLTVRVNSLGVVQSQSDALKAFVYRAAQELLFNVVKHARVKEARLRLRRLGRYICLSVSDRGRGFDPQDTRETTGFGLFSIRERVTLLGGCMKVKSAPGRGAAFYLVLPDGEPGRDGAAAEQRLSEQVEMSSPVQEGPDERLRVLLADDHEIVRQGVASLLSEEPGIRIVGEAANGREAVELAHKLRPDVVVMDVSMPLMNGDEATRQIKRYLPQTRVVALSMHERGEMVETMRRAGAERYVLKTAPSEELIAAIRGRPADEQDPPGEAQGRPPME